MTSTAHALVAGAIAVSIHDPVTASLLAFTSHFILDSIPHWDLGTNWRKRSKTVTGLTAIAETIIGMSLGLLFFRESAPTVTLICAIVASLLPDWLEAPWYIFFARSDKHSPAPDGGFFEHLTYAIYKIENSMHHKAQFPLGVITQIITVIFFIRLLK